MREACSAKRFTLQPDRAPLPPRPPRPQCEATPRALQLGPAHAHPTPHSSHLPLGAMWQSTGVPREGTSTSPCGKVDLLAVFSLTDAGDLVRGDEVESASRVRNPVTPDKTGTSRTLFNMSPIRSPGTRPACK